MLISDIIKEIETFAPKAYQEGYDNSGIQVGNAYTEATGAILSLDVTEAVLDEAIEKKCNLIIAHHPLFFSGIKRLTGANMVERIVIKAIQHGIVIYAAHTNLDNMRYGVNHKIAQKLGLQGLQILSPMTNKLYKLITYVPQSAAGVLQQHFFDACMGQIGDYSECSFSTTGVGTFRPLAHANPHIGTAGGNREYVDEVKLELLVPQHLKQQAIRILKSKHPYEEPAFELVAIENEHPTIGAGMIGTLAKPLELPEFLRLLKTTMNATCIKYTQPHKKIVEKVAVCGGSGSFLLRDAMAAGADVFITADYKYHQFFEAENSIIIADIGHFESEQFTIEIFSEILNEKFPNFALLFTSINTNPVNYYF